MHFFFARSDKGEEKFSIKLKQKKKQIEFTHTKTIFTHTYIHLIEFNNYCIDYLPKASGRFK